MRQKIAFIGLDIDDKAYHVSGINREGVEIASFVVKGSANKLAKELKRRFSDYEIRVCYEASYTGFTQARLLKKRGIDCTVIAPTSIPKSPNDRVKNDRLDALRLAQLWKQGALTAVAMPTEKQEADRALVRSREFMVKQVSDLKRKILSLCREFGLSYKEEIAGAGNYWTKKHRDWLDKKLASLDMSLMDTVFAITTLLAQMEMYKASVRKLEHRIMELSQSPEYASKVQALVCFKGIQVLSAMTILTEIFDIHRFAHPKQLVAFIGLDVREYSSGGRQNQFGISKMGSKRLRKALTESCQLATRSKTPSKILKARRAGCTEAQIEVAERCRLRLYQKGNRLLMRGKHVNKVKTACAREMVGFLWEALRAA